MKKGVMIYTWPADMQVLVSACPVFFLETCVGAWPGGHLYLSGQHALGPVRKKVPVIRHQPGKPWSLVLPWFMFHVSRIKSTEALVRTGKHRGGSELLRMSMRGKKIKENKSARM